MGHMQIGFNKKIVYRLMVFLGSILLWSFFVFSLLKIFLIIYNKPVFLILIYSICCALFWVYYFMNSGYLMSFWKYILSYFGICLGVIAFNRLYAITILLNKALNQYDKFVMIFVLGLIPVVILYFVGKLILKAFKTA